MRDGDDNSATVLYERKGAVASLTLNRPERYNAVSEALVTRLVACLRQANADDGARIVVLRAAGKHFSVGDDLTDFDPDRPDPGKARRVIENFQQVTREILHSRKLFVAVVQGYVVGGAFTWPLNCDLSLWADDACAFLPEAGHGLFVSGGLSAILPHVCGRPRALDMMLTGEKMGVAALRDAGIAARVVPADALAAATDALLERLQAISPRTLMAYKTIVDRPGPDAIEAAMARETMAALDAAADPATLETLRRWAQAKAGQPKKGAVE
jgi:enoyl-CoA hydratase/carnithine racemase